MQKKQKIILIQNQNLELWTHTNNLLVMTILTKVQANIKLNQSKIYYLQIKHQITHLSNIHNNLLYNQTNLVLKRLKIIKVKNRIQNKMLGKKEKNDFILYKYNNYYN